jgi:hypothetical protein
MFSFLMIIVVTISSHIGDSEESICITLNWQLVWSTLES